MPFIAETNVNENVRWVREICIIYEPWASCEMENVKKKTIRIDRFFFGSAAGKTLTNESIQLLFVCLFEYFFFELCWLIVVAAVVGVAVVRSNGRASFCPLNEFRDGYLSSRGPLFFCWCAPPLLLCCRFCYRRLVLSKLNWIKHITTHQAIANITVTHPSSQANIQNTYIIIRTRRPCHYILLQTK